MSKTVETVGIEVDVLKADVGEIKVSIASLYSKIDRSVGELGSEMRRAIDAIGTQINDRSRTPWAVIWAGIGVLLVLSGFIANQALTPIINDVAMLKASIVTRVEHDARWAASDARILRDEQAVIQMQDRRYAESVKTIDRLMDDNKEIRASHLHDLQDQINKGFARDHESLIKANERLETEVRELRRDQNREQNAVVIPPSPVK